MKNSSIIYWSSTGNTALLAEMIADTIDTKHIKQVSNATGDDLGTDVIFLGASAMGVEAVDDSEMLPFIEQHQDYFKGKQIVLFGSYDWGDGEWLETWEEVMTSYGAKSLGKLMVQNTPSDLSEVEKFIEQIKK